MCLSPQGLNLGQGHLKDKECQSSSGATVKQRAQGRDP